MTLSDLQGHFPIASLQMGFLYRCAAVNKISVDAQHRTVPLQQLTLLYHLHTLCNRFTTTASYEEDGAKCH